MDTVPVMCMIKKMQQIVGTKGTVSATLIKKQDDQAVDCFGKLHACMPRGGKAGHSRSTHIQHRVNELCGLVVSVHQSPGAAVDFTVNNGPAEVILKLSQGIILGCS